MIDVCLLEGDKELSKLATSIINETGNAKITSSYYSKNEFLFYLGELSDDLILIDINLSGCNIIRLIAEVKVKRPDLDIIICSAWVQPDLIYESLCAGASSWLNLYSTVSEYTLAITQTIKGQARISIPLAEMIEKHQNQNHGYIFTSKQYQIINMASKGHSVSEISSLLQETTEDLYLNIGTIFRLLNQHN